jgi:hypothetical protein
LEQGFADHAARDGSNRSRCFYCAVRDWQGGQTIGRCAVQTSGSEGLAIGFRLEEKDLRIAATDERAGLANRAAAEANERTKEQEGGIAEARARAPEAEKRAAEARLELERLRTPRSLRPEQQQRVTAKLSAFKGQRFCFGVYPDAEAISLMRALESVLTASGEGVASQIGDIEIEGAGQTFGTGVEAFISPDNDAAVPALVAHRDALSAEGLVCTANRTNQLRNKAPKSILDSRRSQTLRHLASTVSDLCYRISG